MKAAILLCLLVEACVCIENPEESVNLLAGTHTDGDRFSTGNTLPLVGRPWGFNHWSPQTRDGSRNTGSWWFKGYEHRMTWLRCTHQPSPWIGDWGWFLFGPQISSGEGERNPEFFWEPRGAVIKPHMFDATVAPLNIRLELTPTDHGAFLRVTFPLSAEGKGQKRVCFVESEWLEHGVATDGSGVHFLNGRNNKAKQDRMIISNFNMYIRAESSMATSVDSNGDMICFKYASDATVVTVRIATSLISKEQALTSLHREMPISRGYDDVLSESKGVWNKLLRRVDIVDPGDLGSAAKHIIVFYTSLVRALSFPRRLDETTADGRVVHYSPYDPSGRVHDGPSVTDNGFWDTFRTVYPMLSLLYPDHLGLIVQGWLNAYKEGGWLPSWASPGYRNCMVGTYADVVVADAVIKGIKGFDLVTATDALLKDSFEGAPKFAGGSAGKEGLSEYTNRGYLAVEGQNKGETVSRTLDYGFADFATSNALEVLASAAGNEQRKDKLARDASSLRARAERASTALFDPAFGLMVPKGPSGATVNSFRELDWGNGFTEGNSWHHSFPAYALSGLMKLHKGRDNLLKKLHRMLTLPSTFGTGSYGQEIHEMTEMRALAMGQYGHNNQPVHHILYLFALLGERATTESTVRTVMDKAYGVEFYAGDEDNGEQGAWFVMSALGLFSAVPGTPEYVLGTPLFRHVRIQRGQGQGPGGYGVSTEASGAPLDIVALGTSASSKEVREVLVGTERLVLDGDGCVPRCNVIHNSALMRGGVLRFVFEGERSAAGALPPLHLDAARDAEASARTIEELQRQLEVARKTAADASASAAAAPKQAPWRDPKPNPNPSFKAEGTRDAPRGQPVREGRRSAMNTSSFALVLFTVFVVAILVAKLLSSIGVMRSSSYFRKNKSKQDE